VKMSFRGRSFRPRSVTRPPRSGRGGRGGGRPPGPGVRGNFRFPGPESFAGRSATSSQERNERTGFEERDRFHRTRSPDEDVGILICFLTCSGYVVGNSTTNC